jgi:hypothetical protein
MPDRDEQLLAGIDAPRPMPAALRRSLEEALLEGAPLPDDARDRLTERLTELTDPTAALLAGIDGPRPVPTAMRHRIEERLVVPRRRAVRPWLTGVAAALVLALSLVSLGTREDDRGPVPTAGRAIPQSGNDRVRDEVGLDRLSEPSATSGGGAPLLAGPRFGTAPIEPRTGASAAGDGYRGPPPFAYDEALFGTVVSNFATAGSGSAQATTTTTTPPPPPPFKVAIVSGDTDDEAGFRAYVKLLNKQGGAGGRPFVVIDAGRPADVTVNLSDAQFRSAPTGVSIESLLAPDRLLRNDTFGFAGAPDRQAHLMVDAVYPTDVNATAAIYRETSGVLHDDVATAFQTALRAKGLTTVVVDVRPGDAVTPVPADAVFLSLSQASAQRVIAAYPSNAPPARGFNGIGTFADTFFIDTVLPDGVRFISPYSFPDDRETTAIHDETGRPPSAQLYHGWIVAKTLAVAVWQSDPRSPDQLRAALQSMSGYSNGFAPPYSYRSNTNSVRPEGVLFTVRDGKPEQGDFLTDPRP